MRLTKGRASLHRNSQIPRALAKSRTDKKPLAILDHRLPITFTRTFDDCGGIIVEQQALLY
jgi:hypothetical protein